MTIVYVPFSGCRKHMDRCSKGDKTQYSGLIPGVRVGYIFGIPTHPLNSLRCNQGIGKRMKDVYNLLEMLDRMGFSEEVSNIVWSGFPEELELVECDSFLNPMILTGDDF